MALIIGLATNDTDAAVKAIIATMAGLASHLQQWRASINASSAVSGSETELVYQHLTSARTLVQARIAASQGAALTAAYLRQFENVPANYNVGAEWATSTAAIGALITWIRDSWPHKTGNGHPAWSQFSAGTGELADLTVAISGATKTSVLANIDAVLATFA